MWTIFKVSIQFVTILLLFYVLVFWLRGMWDLSSLKSEVKVKVAQSCLTLCDPMDYTVHGILQARILEWVAFPFSRDRIQVSHIAGGLFTG